MKKFIPVLLSLAIVLSLASCGGGDKGIDGLTNDRNHQTNADTEGEDSSHSENENSPSGETESDPVDPDNISVAEDISWKYENGVLTISGNGKMPDYSQAKSPWQEYADSTTKVVVENGIKSIGDFAFYGFKNADTFEIPDDIVAIGNHAFLGCKNIRTFDIPEGTLTVGVDVFENCASLEELTIPKNVEKFRYGNLGVCESLRTITVDSKNKKLCDVDGVLFSKNKKSLFIYPAAREGVSYDVPDGVERIEDSAFIVNKNLETVTLPDSVLNIHDYAFQACEKLTAVNISEGVQQIGERVFYNCKKLSDMNLPASLESIGKDTFTLCSSLTDIYFAGNADDWSSFTVEVHSRTTVHCSDGDIE